MFGSYWVTNEIFSTTRRTEPDDGVRAGNFSKKYGWNKVVGNLGNKSNCSKPHIKNCSPESNKVATKITKAVYCHLAALRNDVNML